MDRKLALFSFTVILLASLLGAAFKIERVQAIGTIYIRGNGSIDPPTANITTPDNITYTFTDNIYDSIVVERGEIVVDGVGFIVQGNGTGIGFSLQNIANVTIKNVEIKGFGRGIYLYDGSSNNTIFRNTIANNDGDGIWLDGWSNFNTVSKNNITSNNRFGIYLTYEPSDNVFSGNNITANEFGGIVIGEGDDNTISGNNITNNGGDGISIEYSGGNSISGNTIIANTGDGVYLFRAGSPIFGNNITRNRGDGVSLQFSGGYISGNNITANYGNGVDFEWSSSYSAVSGNTITNNSNGIEFEWSSNYNIITENTIMDNDDGVRLSSSGWNVIFHNTFVSNGVQALSDNLTNVWDDGYPSGGNYWSNYNGSDMNTDGIGDTPYVLNFEADRFPLMGMFSSFNATAEHSVQTVCNSTIFDFQYNGTAISFDVAGENGTTGFCRIMIPGDLMNEAYRVFVNAIEILPAPRPLPFSNSTHSYLYFTYEHSTKEVVIIPEFSLVLLPLFMLATLLTAIVYRKKRILTD